MSISCFVLIFIFSNVEYASSCQKFQVDHFDSFTFCSRRYRFVSAFSNMLVTGGNKYSLCVEHICAKILPRLNYVIGPFSIPDSLIPNLIFYHKSNVIVH